MKMHLKTEKNYMQSKKAPRTTEKIRIVL